MRETGMPKNRLDELADILRKEMISERWREMNIVDWEELDPGKQEAMRRGVRALAAELIVGGDLPEEMVTEEIAEDEDPGEGDIVSTREPVT